MTAVALRDVNDLSCVATIKHEHCSSIVLCIPEVAPRDVNDVLYVATFKISNKLILCSSESYFVVWSSVV